MPGYQSALEQQKERKYLAEIAKQNFKPPVVLTVDDIRKVLQSLDPSADLPPERVDINVDLEVTTNRRGNREMFKASTPSVSISDRARIIKELSVIKQRQELLNQFDNDSATVINGIAITPATPLTVDVPLPVDTLIRNKLGATRSGYLICWRLPDGYTYRYDIFEHRLKRTKNEPSD